MNHHSHDLVHADYFVENIRCTERNVKTVPGFQEVMLMGEEPCQFLQESVTVLERTPPDND
jgi:hypothetical protein